MDYVNLVHSIGKFACAAGDFEAAWIIDLHANASTVLYLNTLCLQWCLTYERECAYEVCLLYDLMQQS